jgi:pimeloyl-ACP methyl ester carboxylesterase
MILLLWLLLPIGLILLAGLVASFYVTRRMPRTAFHTPDEFGLQFEDVTIPALDGVQIHGCWIPSEKILLGQPVENERAVIILHGHGGSLDWDVHRAPALHEAGFNVFLIDFRAHGQSQGRLATFGYLERKDVVAAVKFLLGRGVKSIGLMGFSYGGIASMLSAPICPEIKAVVTDGGPIRMKTALRARAIELHVPPILAGPLAWLTFTITSLRLGVNLFRYEPVRWVAQIAPRPILFIHGELDQYCPDFDDLYSAAGEPKELWRLPGVGHTMASEVHPQEYQARVLEFFNCNL